MSLFGGSSINVDLELAKARAKEERKIIERNRSSTAKIASSGLSGQLRSIKKAIQSQSQNQFSNNQNRNQVVIQQRFEQTQQKKPIFEPPNFFASKDETEVYGDEGLTFFDSNKNRGNGRTGGLFGI